MFNNDGSGKGNLRSGSGGGAYAGNICTGEQSPPLPSPASARSSLPSTSTAVASSSTAREERSVTQGANRWILAGSSSNYNAPSNAQFSAARSSRRFDNVGQRPGTASTVSSYTSARPYQDDNSPVRQTFALPSIDSVSSSHHQSIRNEGSPSTAEMLLHGGASVYTLPIGGGNASKDSSVGKRQIVASAAAAFGAGKEEDEVLSASSSKKTIPVYDDEVLASVLGSSSPRRSDAASPTSRSSSVEARRSSASTSNVRKDNASASVPVHPHHRRRNDDGSSMKLSESATDNSLKERAPPTPSSSRNLNRALPATPAKSITSAQGTPQRGIHKQTLPSSDLEPYNVSVETTNTDRGPAGTGALRDRFKKTGGFFRRLGGGGPSSSSSSSSASSSAVNPANGADNSLTGLTKSSKLGFSASRKPLSRKSSNASIAAEVRPDLGAWTREDGIPVPNVPQKFREENEARVKTLGNWERHEDGGGDAAASDGITPSASVGMDRALRAWEKEMDAALETSGQDLAEKTKIEPPRPNWTPSPQLPEYRVLNRKGSFMDEGMRATTGDDHASDDSDADGDTASRYTTVRSYMAPSTLYSVGGTGRPGLSEAFGIGVPGSSTTDSKMERSKFLRPDRHLPSTTSASRSVSSPLTPSPTSIMDRKPSRTFSAGPAASVMSAMSSAGTMTEPIKPSSKFFDAKQQHNSSYDEVESIRRARQENGSSATARSFETAFDRQPYAANNSTSVDDSHQTAGRKLGGVVNRPSPFASRGSSDVSHEATTDAVTASEGIDQTEPSIRLVSDAARMGSEQSGTSKAVAAESVLDDAEFKRPLSPASEASACAERCWDEDETFKPREKIAEWLGGYKEVNSAACKLYFDKFDFKGLSLDQAFRKLCDKLFLRAETQQIDRILQVFSRRYYECNRQTQLRNADVIHAVTFSILLLNTDLHVAELSDRMTRQQFVRNTIDAIVESNAIPNEGKSNVLSVELQLEGVLREIYNSVKSERIRLPVGDSASLPLPTGGTTIRAAGTERFNALKRGSIRGLQGLMGSPSSASAEGEASGFALRSGSHRGSPNVDRRARLPISTLPPPTLHLTPTIGFASTLSKSIIREANDEEGAEGILSASTSGNVETSSMESSTDDISDEDLALMGAPWAKEGMLTRKQYWEAPQKRAKDKNWIECFVVIQKGQLSMFRFGTGTSGTIKQSSSSLVGGGNWLQNATCIGQFSLAHSLANILPPPGYNRNRPHVFALSLSNGSVFFFQTGHEELAQEWTSTCNYWAARLSKEPLAAGVSNMEYGWNRVQTSSASSSANDMAEQYEGGPQIEGIPRNSGTRSTTGSINGDEEQIAEAASPSTSQAHLPNYSAIGTGYGSKAAADTRSIRSGRSSKSGRMRSAMSQALFHNNWNGGGGSASGGHSLDRTVSSGALGHQSGVSSPVASLISLSTPNTSVITLDRPLIVHEWRTPAPPSAISTLSEEEQLEACTRHTQRIENDLTEHNSLRQPMLTFFKALSSSTATTRQHQGASGSTAASSSLSLSPKPKNASAISLTSSGGKRGGQSASSSSTNTTTMANRAMANWERKSAYLLAELTKYQVYIDSLQSANRLRTEKRDERQLSRMMRQADEELSNVKPAHDAQGAALET